MTLRPISEILDLVDMTPTRRETLDRRIRRWWRPATSRAWYPFGRQHRRCCRHTPCAESPTQARTNRSLL